MQWSGTVENDQVYESIVVKAKDEGDISHVSRTYMSLSNAAIFTAFR